MVKDSIAINPESEWDDSVKLYRGPYTIVVGVVNVDGMFEPSGYKINRRRPAAIPPSSVRDTVDISKVASSDNIDILKQNIRGIL